MLKMSLGQSRGTLYLLLLQRTHFVSGLAFDCLSWGVLGASVGEQFNMPSFVKMLTTTKHKK